MADEPAAAGSAAVASRVILRPIASPLPLGLLGLFIGSLLLSALQLRWIPVGESNAVVIGVLAITVPLQSIGCVFGFLGRDAACGSGMGLLAGTWAGAGVILLVSPSGQAEPGLGIVLVVAAGALLVPMTAGAAGKALVGLVFAAAAARFAISGAYELTGSPVWQHSSGVAGIVVAGLAGYAALAFELEGTLGHSVLPVGRLGRGRRAASGRFADQTADLAHEAGVRTQL